MKKIVIIVIAIIGVTAIMLFPRETQYSYERAADNSDGFHYETVTERTVKCVFIGDDTYVTEDGNMWVYNDGKERKIDHRYMITISDNATTTEIKDDIVMFVK